MERRTPIQCLQAFYKTFVDHSYEFQGTKIRFFCVCLFRPFYVACQSEWDVCAVFVLFLPCPFFPACLVRLAVLTPLMSVSYKLNKKLTQMARGLYLCGLGHATSSGGSHQQVNKDRFWIRFQNLVQVHGESPGACHVEHVQQLLHRTRAVHREGCSPTIGLHPNPSWTNSVPSFTFNHS